MAKRVLVVDDEADLRTLLRLLLETDSRCVEIAEADSGEAALREAERTDPHSVILDFMLGDQTADMLLPTLRKTCPEARIIVFTAAPEIAHAAGVLSHGADLLATKVGNIDEILELSLDY